MTERRSTCPYCGVGCGVIADSLTGQVRGDTDHPANMGRLCSKGSALAETLGHDDRLLYPAINGHKSDWDTALDLVAGRFQETIDAYGPDSVAFYVSGQCLTEDYYVANKLMKGFIGSGNIDTNSRLCMASSVAGHIRAFGEDVVPGVYEDLEKSDLVVLVGSNLAWCHPILYQRLSAARERRGTKVVVIDPRRTVSCEIADLHLPLAAGTDVALFAGLLNYLAQDGKLSPKWIEDHTDGIDGALLAAASDVAEINLVSGVTALPLEDLATFYRWFAETDRTVTVYSQGVNQSSVGTDKVNAIINCHLATGRIGRVGMGPFSVTGQPNAMGGREVGGLSNQLAAHMGFDSSLDLDLVQRFWNAPSLATKPGLKAVDLFNAVAAGRIKAILIMATNPAASMPNAKIVSEALERCPFVVVADCWNTDTTSYAHVLLPAAGWGEKGGTVTNSERVISRQRAFRASPGDAKPDWWMLSQIAQRMGFTRAFSFQNTADIFREHAALSAFENDGRRVFDIGGMAKISNTAFDAMEPFRWPYRQGETGDSGRLFGNGVFATPNGRACFVPTRFRPALLLPDETWPLVLNTGRIRDQWHTMTRTGRVPRLMTHLDEPKLAIHPTDARRHAIKLDDLVLIETPYGRSVLRAELTETQRRGEIFSPMHWTDSFSSSGPIDRLVSPVVDRISGQPDLKFTVARVNRMATKWRGFLVRRTPVALPDDFYWVRIPMTGGMAYELAGWTDLPASLEELVENFLQPLGGTERIETTDARRGIFRYAYMVDGVLDSCLFLAPAEGDFLPSRTMVATMLAESSSSLGGLTVLAGRPAGVIQETGRTVCVCFSVGLATLRQAIVSGGLTSVAEIGTSLRAGTNCGSCIPELGQILLDVKSSAA